MGESLDQLTRVLEDTQEVSPFRFVGFDGNGRSPLWGPESVAVDFIGGSIENVLVKNKLLVINYRNCPHTF